MFFSHLPSKVGRSWVKLAVALLPLASVGHGFCAEPVGYYTSTAGLSGAALRTTLNSIIKTGHVPVGYSNARFSLEETDVDPADVNRLLLVYSGESKHKVNDWLNNNTADGWNREHLWPDSLGIDGGGAAYSDLHHLRPCDEQVNSDRGNLYFDESDPAATGYQSSANVEAPACTQDANSWEPLSSHKGDIARAMFYMDVRYEGGGTDPNLQLTDNTALITTSAAYMGKLTTLLTWHFLDPVSAEERLRNDRVQAEQGNRNPFVDRPEFVERVYGDVFKLSLLRNGANLQLQWPSQLPALMHTVEQSGDFMSWVSVSGSPIVVGSWRTLSFTLPSAPKFYRLRLMARSG